MEFTNTHFRHKQSGRSQHRGHQDVNPLMKLLAEFLAKRRGRRSLAVASAADAGILLEAIMHIALSNHFLSQFNRAQCEFATPATEYPEACLKPAG
jgi:hypothetical protein